MISPATKHPWVFWVFWEVLENIENVLGMFWVKTQNIDQ